MLAHACPPGSGWRPRAAPSGRASAPGAAASGASLEEITVALATAVLVGVVALVTSSVVRMADQAPMYGARVTSLLDATREMVPAAYRSYSPLEEVDLARVQAWQARMVVSFVEQHEFDEMDLPPFGRELAQVGTAWRHYPIHDFSVPTPQFQEHWDGHLHEIEAILNDGARVLFHCRGGLGRSGTMAAWVLVHYGHTAEEAIALVRRARGEGAIETRDQEKFLFDFAATAAAAGQP